MNRYVEIQQALRDDEPPPDQVFHARRMQGVLDAVVELFPVQEVVKKLLASVTLDCCLYLGAY